MPLGNDVSASGFTDNESYVIVIEVKPRLSPIWHEKTGERYTSGRVGYNDFDGDGKMELMITAQSNSANTASHIVSFLDPVDYSLKLQQVLSGSVKLIAQGMNLDQDGDLELVGIDADGNIIVYDHKLEIVDTIKRELPIQGIGYPYIDIDRDGFREIFVRTGEGLELLGRSLKPMVQFPGETEMAFEVLRQGPSKMPYLLAKSRIKKAVAYELVPTPYYGVRRLLPVSLIGAFTILAAGLGFIFVRNRKQNNRLTRIQAITHRSDERGIASLTPSGKHQYANAQYNRWRLGASDFEEKFVAVIAELAVDPPMRRTKETVLALSTGEKTSACDGKPVGRKI